MPRSKNSKKLKKSDLISSLIEQVISERERKISLLSFPEQDAFVNDPSQFLAAICTRRAGKTNGLARRFKRTMDEYPGSMSRYIALTRDSAKDIMWPVLQEMDEKFHWEASFTESNLTMTLPNDSKLRLFGADMKNFIRRLKGAKSPAVGVDEVQDFGDHVESLIEDVLTPTIIDYPNSWIALTGTPGAIPRGLFYDVTESGIGDYSLHRWSLYQNPYLPNAQDFVDRLKERKKWDDKNPTFLREYKGIWVLDLESLVVRYDSTINHFDNLPSHNWIYILGVDIGFNDADALAVLAWSPSTPDIYLVEEVVTTKQDITALAESIESVSKIYDISKIVMDAGALGKKIAEELTRRKHIPIQAADKMRKMENIAFLNEWLRLGRFKARKDSQFAQDSYKLQIDHDKTTPDRIVVKKGFHSDIIDSVLYAFKESPAFTYQKPPDVPKYGTPAWAKQETIDMEQAAEDHFRAMEEMQKRSFG